LPLHSAGTELEQYFGVLLVALSSLYFEWRFKEQFMSNVSARRLEGLPASES
jgi:hypothetical protein